MPKFMALHSINLPGEFVTPGQTFEYDEAAAAHLVRVGACRLVEPVAAVAAPVVEAVEQVGEEDDLGLGVEVSIKSPFKRKAR